MKKPTVLLVDYDPMSIESTRRPLALAGYDVALAKNGVAGLEAFRQVDPDIVLTQLMLPRLPGLDLCREIRKTRPAGRPPILVYGTTPAEKGRSQALAAGADGYLVAPMNPETLVETCNDYLMGCGIEALEEIGESPEPGGVPAEAPLSSENEHAAAAAEILERLDAFLPSRPVEIPAPPIVESAVAAPAAVIRDETPAPSTVPPIPQTEADASPAVEATATVTATVVERPVRSPVHEKEPGRAGVRWTRVLPALALGAGLLVVIVALRGRALPGREPRAPASPGVERSISSEAVSNEAQPSNEHTHVAAATQDPANLAPPVASPEGATAQRLPESTRGGSKVATDPRSESSREDPGVPVASTTVSPGVAANARGAESEPVSEPALFPGTKPASAAAVPVAPPEPDAASGELFNLASPETRAAATSELPATADPSPKTPIRAGELVELDSVDTQPVARSRTQPAYPEVARRMRYSGTAVLRILVDETGRVAEAEPEGAPARKEFLAAAIKAVRTWTYSPATKNGVPVKTRITVQIVFQP
jgi:TonB family protein